MLTPIRDPSLRERLDEILGILLADDVLAWELLSDGTWLGPAANGTVNT